MSSSSLFLSPNANTIDTRYVSPLNAPLSAGGFAISDVGSVSSAIVRTEQIALPAGSLSTSILVSDPLQASLSRSGTAVILAGQTSVVVTVAGVTAASVIVATLSEVDATALAVGSVVPGAGSFTISVNAAATADTNVSFLIAKL